jgi:hypothetical protein
MSKLRFQLAVSLDGYAAGRDQSEENPLGVGGMDLHQWLIEPRRGASSKARRVARSTPARPWWRSCRRTSARP